MSFKNITRKVERIYESRIGIKICLHSQQILVPQGNHYMNLAKACVKSSVSIDLFLFPNSYIDVATLGLMVTQTGGQIYRYSYFKVCMIFSTRFSPAQPRIFENHNLAWPATPKPARASKRKFLNFLSLKSEILGNLSIDFAQLCSFRTTQLS